MSNNMQISKDQKGKHSTLVNADIINISSGGGVNYMKIKISKGKTQYAIIIDHDRINNVPMIENMKSEQHEDQKLRRKMQYKSNS
jgi:hypothetical protein